MKKGVLRTFEEVRSFLDRVCTIADSNRSIFGFLPKGAYEELAARDQLWIATNSQGGLAGYVLFGGGKGRMRIFQLYVEETARQSGIGKQLLSELKSLAGSRGYQTISARVAADLEGNSFWERQGFRIVKQVAGGQTTNRLINERLFELTGCSLWQPAIGGNDAWPLLPLKQPILSVSNYVIDLNVLFDVTKDREHAALMREVITNALSNEYRLSVTPEFSKELERTSISPDPILTLAKSLPTLPPVPPKVLEPVIAELRSIVFPETGRSARRHANDESDLIHLAVCIHHKVSGFITRESAILRGSRQLLERYGLEVLSPADLSTGGLTPDSGLVSMLAQVNGRAFAVASLHEGERQSAERFLRGQGLHSASVRMVLDPGTTKSARVRLIFTLDSNIVAVASWGPIGRQTREFLLYLIVDESVSLSQRAVDHVLEAAALSAPAAHMVQISLLTLRAQLATRETANKRGFVLRGEADAEDGFVTSTRYLYRRVVSAENWSQFAQEVETVTGMKITRRCPTYSELTNTGLVFERRNTNDKRPVPLFQLETAFAPVIILGAGRPGVITPIREDYANDLISSATKQFTLFGKEAPVHLERAYFGKPGIERSFVRGAIVVFYISGRRNEAVGFGRVTASGRYSLSEAQAIFSRQGVLTNDELKRISVDGQIGVFTFDGYRNFERAISFSELRQKEVASASNLVTSQQVTFDQLLKVFTLGEIR